MRAFGVQWVRVGSAAAAFVAAPVLAQDPAPIPGADVDAFLGRYCVDCHGGADPKGGVDLRAELADSASRSDALLDVREVLSARDMPPADADQPTDAERRAVLAALGDELAAALAADAAAPRPRTPTRRLSRVEYANAVRDLLGVDARDLVESIPANDLSYGFDNVGDGLTLSTLHLERYAAVAESIARRAFPFDPGPQRRRLQAESMTSTLDGSSRGDVQVLYSNADLSGRVELPRAGTYEVVVAARATQAGDEFARLALAVDGERVLAAEVAGTERDPRAETRVRVAVERHDGGPCELTVSFVNDYYEPEHPDPQRRDRNLIVDWVEIHGPAEPLITPVPAQRLLELAGHGPTVAARVRPLLRELATRAWRRAPAPALLDALVDHVAAAERGASFEQAVREGCAIVLTSPRFLFRLESADADHDTRGHELATRLAFFLWSSVPDTALLASAARGELDDVETRVRVARRLLADPRADALATNFAAQWLELRQLDAVTPDPGRFPAFGSELATAFRREAEAFFATVLRERRGVVTLLDADFAVWNAELARFYGVPAGSLGDRFERVTLGAEARGRGGILGQGAFLAVTSNPTRTSPVQRGKWILDNLLGDPLPPPPPGADSFEGGDATDAATLRERMAQHRQRAECAACHVHLDPLGLALENFDAIGRWRTHDGVAPIDASAELEDGTRLNGVDDLRAHLLADGGTRFARGLADKLFVFGVGRPPTAAERLALDELVAAADGDPTLEDLILGIVAML